MSRVYQRGLVGLAFAALLLTGLLVFRDYGYSWDEQISRWWNGRPNYTLLSGGKRRLLDETDEKYHGPAFEIVLYAAERGLRLHDTRTVYFMRHLLTFLLFFASVVVFYRVLRRRFHSRMIGLAGATILVLSPRIFADAFYNSKDLALLSAYVFALATLGRFLRRPGHGSAALHALACSFLIDIRILGAVVPVLTLALVPACWWARRRQGDPTPLAVKPLLAFALLTGLFVTLFWPILWRNPPLHLYRAFREMSKYPWDSLVLYRGQLIPATRLPWHYLPWWMLITTPPLYLLLFAVGAGRFLAGALRGPLRLLAGRPADVAWGAAFFGPLGAVIALHATVYDGWRHLYFIYPAFVFLAVVGLATLIGVARVLARRARFAVPALLAACAVPVIATAWVMVRDHPYQNVYFNALAGPDLNTIKHNYELDYWGLSARAGLEKLLARDTRPVVTIIGDTNPIELSLMMLPPEQRARVRITNDISRADYFLSHYRNTREFPGEDRAAATVRVENANLFVALKLRDEEGVPFPR
jgi:hypothetical protein